MRIGLFIGLFSNRHRLLKFCASLALILPLSLGFHAGPGSDSGSSYHLAIRGELTEEDRGALIGPEYLLITEIRPDGILVENGGIPLELIFAENPAGRKARAAAGSLGPGRYLSATCRYLEGNRFEVVELRARVHRNLKFLVSGLATAFLAILFPLFYRWSGGAFRPRRGPPERVHHA